jgi:beta-glucosidase
VIVVLFNGRPLDLSGIVMADAILEAWFPGSKAAQGIADILLGDVNPSGKLPISFPRNVGQIPVYYNHFNTGRPYLGKTDRNEYVSKYLDVENTPLFAFGHGLSYSNFEYNNLTISASEIKSTDTVDVTIDVKNLGPYDGFETVQLYVRDHHGRVVRPMMELKQFVKPFFYVGETKTIRFTLSNNDFAYLLEDGSRILEPGKFTIFVGPSSDQNQLVSLKIN